MILKNDLNPLYIEKYIGHIDVTLGFEGFHMNYDQRIRDQINEEFRASVNRQITTILKEYYDVVDKNVQHRWNVGTIEFFSKAWLSCKTVYETIEELEEAIVSKVRDMLQRSFSNSKRPLSLEEKVKINPTKFKVDITSEEREYLESKGLLKEDKPVNEKKKEVNKNRTDSHISRLNWKDPIEEERHMVHRYQNCKEYLSNTYGGLSDSFRNTLEQNVKLYELEMRLHNINPDDYEYHMDPIERFWEGI